MTNSRRFCRAAPGYPGSATHQISSHNSLIWGFDVYLLVVNREKVVLELATDKLTVWMFAWMFDRMHQAPTAPIPGVQSNTKSLKLAGNQQMKNCQKTTNWESIYRTFSRVFPFRQDSTFLAHQTYICSTEEQISLLQRKLHTAQ